MANQYSCSDAKPDFSKLDPQNMTDEVAENHKLIIYQTLVRHFGNTNETNKHYGSIEENGVGKFNDYTEKALLELKEMGYTHIWYTGVIEHATMTDYSAYGIKVDDPDIVKGRAGSPYAIKDYYDVSPDLAVDVAHRMQEFEALVTRTHAAGMKVIIDFVPNHVARTYYSDAKPEGVRDFGEDDDTSVVFSPRNDFYYIPGEPLVIPTGYNAGGNEFQRPLKDGFFDENPAKVTGNDVFSSRPTLNDWSETVKLNYGWDYQNGKTEHFDPIPPVWTKTRDILLYWAAKGVDGFRCDMAEMVPVAYWNWMITELKAQYPDLVFIAEAYDKNQYRNFIEHAKFDYLYDKVGLYDGLKKLMRDEPDAHIDVIRYVWNEESRGFSNRMLRFLENHDEQRIASPFFAGDPWPAVPAMVVSATLSTGPVMVYAGQELGEPGAGDMGFSTEDGRTTIFDYWGVPQHQKWVNGGAFDGGRLDDSTRMLRQFYNKLLLVSRDTPAIAKGRFYDLTRGNEHSQGFGPKTYAYLRFTESDRVLVVSNFQRYETTMQVYFPDDVREVFGLNNHGLVFEDLLSGKEFETQNINGGVSVTLPAASAVVLKF